MGRLTWIVAGRTRKRYVFNVAAYFVKGVIESNKVYSLKKTSTCRTTVLLIQSTLVIWNSKRLTEILGDIRNLTYQICRNEEIELSEDLTIAPLQRYQRRNTHSVKRF